MTDRYSAFLVVKHWPYFYERSIGCIGVLKDWLVRAVSATMADKQPKLLFERIQECALPLAQCESMAMEAASGEQELRYTASRRQHLWHLLGMTMETEEQPAEPAPPVTSPQNAHPSGKLRVGEPKPQRYEVGEPKKGRAGRKMLVLPPDHYSLSSTVDTSWCGEMSVSSVWGYLDRPQQNMAFSSKTLRCQLHACLWCNLKYLVDDRAKYHGVFLL